MCIQAKLEQAVGQVVNNDIDPQIAVSSALHLISQRVRLKP